MNLLNDRIDEIGAGGAESDDSLVEGAGPEDEKKFLRAQKAKK
jgi:hypothetical protein